MTAASRYGFTPVTMLKYPNVGLTLISLNPASRSISESSCPEYCLPVVHPSMIIVYAAAANGPVLSLL